MLPTGVASLRYVGSDPAIRYTLLQACQIRRGQQFFRKFQGWAARVARFGRSSLHRQEAEVLVEEVPLVLQGAEVIFIRDCT
mmetsp:Transcript_81416/g.143750  ORF Transcript_81416/g.143750 Transcript_81416/m.143750 type:complete len:82 (+) Transcript_81416:943-1188(+)